MDIADESLTNNLEQTKELQVLISEKTVSIWLVEVVEGSRKNTST
jgi:hypothetical protein